MNTLARSAFSIGAASALLVGCGASQPAFEPPAAARANTLAPRTGQGQAFLAVGAYARSLLYVDVGFAVEAYTYPRGKPVGALGWGGYLCSDTHGNIILAGGEGISYVWVFPHGGSNPIATLFNPDGDAGCSVDQSSGNIAVASPSGGVVVFPYNAKRGWRLARLYNDPKMRASLYCTYDPQGNLFLDGYNTSISFTLAELPKGGSTFTTITLDQVVQSPGSVQWDGTDLAIEDAGASRSSTAIIYRFSLSGSSGHRISKTTLADSVAGAQFLIHGGTVIGPVSHDSVQGIGFWRFPAGGAPVRVLPTNAYPTAEALSLK